MTFYLSERTEQLEIFQPQQPFQPSQQNASQSGSMRKICVAVKKIDSN